MDPRRCQGRRVPLLVKVSPDEPDDRLDAFADAALASGADGLIATNTTLDRAAVAGHPRAGEQGGLSGAPLRDKALRACARQPGSSWTCNPRRDGHDHPLCIST